ncbi:aminotransferase A [Fervidibacillus halotolerans]|uniref:Aminotransferase n=1 Tax=Fervidibacillus halotolerans TaxID=2980027 RepID=A0A9E8M122_9BACI|nr:aminotransferase A [Fervidibacillus halotolerans]WAA13221.1 aminotransferase A [Fervidibacillus halotolerans]
MEQFLNDNVKSIQISGIRQFFQMIQSEKDLISLTIGQPDFPTPKHIKEAAKRAIDQNVTAYTENAGMFPLRKAAANFLSQKYGIHYQPESEVIVTIGATQGIDLALRTILHSGDEVLLPGPIYPGYEPLVRLAGGVPVYMDTRRTYFKVTAEMIEKHVTEQTRCLILTYPSNPTGVSYSKEELKKLAEVLRRKNIFVLADEIYSELTYEANHTSIANFLPEQTIVINGLSKSHSMTGWRIGFAFAREWLAKEMLKVHQYNVTCASSVSQMAALEALTVGMDDPVDMRMEYRKRRDYVYKRLVNMGFETIMPDGAFYFFVKIPESFQMSSLDYCLMLVKKYRVSVVPGSTFSKYGEGYFRLSFAQSMEQLAEGLDRLERSMKYSSF